MIAAFRLKLNNLLVILNFQENIIFKIRLNSFGRQVSSVSTFPNNKSAVSSFSINHSIILIQMVGWICCHNWKWEALLDAIWCRTKDLLGDANGNHGREACAVTYFPSLRDSCTKRSKTKLFFPAAEFNLISKWLFKFRLIWIISGYVYDSK